jgi:hypothetical protein
VSTICSSSRPWKVIKRTGSKPATVTADRSYGGCSCLRLLPSEAFNFRGQLKTLVYPAIAD